MTGHPPPSNPWRAAQSLIAWGEGHLALWGLFVGCCLSATWTDPLALWGDPLGASRASGHRLAEVQEEAFRQAWLRRAQPQSLLLGTSRSRWALTMANGPPDGLNAAMGGTHMVFLARLGLDALNQAKAPRRLLLELHPWTFCGEPSRKPLWLDDPGGMASAWWKLSANWRAWQQSAACWEDLKHPSAKAYGPDGRGVDLQVFRRPEAQPDPFRRHWRSYINDFAPHSDAAPFSPEAWAALDQLLSRARSQRVEVQVFLPPNHALERVVLEHRLGRRALRRWREGVVRRVGKVWDFSALEGVALMPPNGLAWRTFLDPSHLRPGHAHWTWGRLGLGGPWGAPPTWGRPLTMANLAKAEAHDAVALKAWLERHRPAMHAMGWKVDALSPRP